MYEEYIFRIIYNLLYAPTMSYDTLGHVMMF